jgi:UDP-glucose 6-dehydrogenase
MTYIQNSSKKNNVIIFTNNLNSFEHSKLILLKVQTTVDEHSQLNTKRIVAVQTFFWFHINIRKD